MIIPSATELRCTKEKMNPWLAKQALKSINPSRIQWCQFDCIESICEDPWEVEDRNFFPHEPIDIKWPPPQKNHY